MDPVLYGPGEGEHHDAGSAQIVIKAAGEHTGGSFFLAESTLAPGFAGPPPHRHRELHDMFYVLDGTLTLRLGDRTIDAGPGSFACVPPGVVHTFRNDSDGPVRLLNFNTPAGWENYMRDLAEAAQLAPLSPEVIARVHGTTSSSLGSRASVPL
jgi:quercetin dioxygenase-like cupin family protein